ncbi:MAG: hypothetical protein GMKNLPBB_00738 [Myxococcota bacterium]|nr:hypothetical protein [Myxococcota bacterium]
MQATITKGMLMVIAATAAAQAADSPSATPIQHRAFEYVTRSKDGKIVEYRHKKNGIQVLVAENHAAPVATFMVTYKVGSRNEAVGHTGSTHLLEHLMFKGSDRFNKKAGTSIDNTLRPIGAQFNATTWNDRTNYFATLPSSRLEMYVDMEADRMTNAWIREEDRRDEMTVVRNELERGENDFNEVLSNNLYAHAFKAHPYHHPTIGWVSDVENVSIERLRQFYREFYHPANASLIFAGDVTVKQALDLSEKYFGKIRNPKNPPPKVYTTEPEQQGEIRFTIERDAPAAHVMIGYRTPPSLHEDTYALLVLDAIMSGAYGSKVTSRLYQALMETQLATEFYSNPDLFHDEGLFKLYAAGRPGVHQAALEQKLLEVVDDIRRNGVRADEVVKAKNQTAAAFVYAQEGTTGLAFNLSESVARGDWRFYETYLEKVNKVTVDDVKRVANKYLVPRNRTVGVLLPPLDGQGGGSGGHGHGSGGLASRSRDWSGVALPIGYKNAMEHAGGPRFLLPPSRDDFPAIPAASPPPAEASGAAWRKFIGGKNSEGPNSFKKRVKSVILPNGLTLQVLSNPGSGSVAIRGNLLAGDDRDPRGKRGLADITAAMLSNGTAKHGKLEIAGQLENVGARITFDAGIDNASFSAKSLAKDFLSTLELLAEMMTHPSFPQDELKKEIAKAAAQLKQAEKDTGAMAGLTFLQSVFPEDHPFFSHSIASRLSMLQSLSRDDLIAFHRDHYTGGSLVMTIVGDVDAADAIKAVEAAFARLPRGAPVQKLSPAAPSKKPGAKPAVASIKDKPSTNILWGHFADLPRYSDDFFAGFLGNGALGGSTFSGRLGNYIRDEKGWTYGVNSYFTSGLYAGPWQVSVTVNPKYISSTLDAIRDITSKYVSEGITETELKREQGYTVGSFQVSLATNDGMAASLQIARFHGLDAAYLDAYPEIINSMTREIVSKAMKRLIRPADAHTAMAGSIDEDGKPLK